MHCDHVFFMWESSSAAYVHRDGCLVIVEGADRGGSAGRVDATRGSKHRGLEHAREKRK
jgi:hypothetical protein